MRSPKPAALPAAAALTAAALLAVAACASPGNANPANPPITGTPPPRSHAGTLAPDAKAIKNTVRTARIGRAIVLATATGRTLYWFTLDTTTRSKCGKQCTLRWHPLKGPITAVGIIGIFSVIKRPDGTIQATYDGHPLYTYTGDTAPGQAHGSNMTQSGGTWKETTISRSA